MLITKFDPDMDQEHPVSVYISTAKTLFIRQNTAYLWYFNTFFCRDTVIQNTEKDGLSSLSSPSDTNSESDTLKKKKKVYPSSRSTVNHSNILSVSQGGPVAHRGVHNRRSVHMVRMSVIDADARRRLITEH